MDFRKVELREIFDSISIKHKFDKERLIFLNTSDILDGEVLHNDYSEVRNFPGQAKKSIQYDDILYSEIRPKNKRFALVNFDAEDYVVSTKLMVLRIKEEMKKEVDLHFIYKFISSNAFINELQTIAESRSGTFPQITFSEFGRMTCNLPPISYQRKILKIISSIDNKRTNNSEIINNLENTAKTLIKRWLIDFEFPNKQGLPYRTNGGEMIISELGEIPIGWKVKSLGEIAEVKGGKRLPKGMSVQEEITNHPYIRVKDFINKTIDRENINYITSEIHEKIKNYTISSDDIYISVAGTVGLTGLVPQKFSGANLTENANKITPLENTISKYYILEFLNSTLGIEQVKSKIVGSTQPKLPLYGIKDIKVIIPEEKKLRLINNVLEKCYFQKEFFEDNNQILGELRNMLLPKLLSGEIEIPDESVVES